MKILAIDTSSKNCSVAIVEANKNNYEIITFKNSDDEKTHSQKLMPMIDEAFKESKLCLDKIDLLACCLGPGSFTGIRIGIATIKAFADAKNISTVGSTSLESLAYNIEENGIICPIIDCKNENVYSSLFSNTNGSYSQIGNNVADNINSCIDIFINNLQSSSSKVNRITFVGNGSVLYKDLILQKVKEANLSLKVDFSNKNTQSSISLAKSAYDKYQKGLYGDSNYIFPVYLRKSQAERAKFGD